MNGKSDPLAVSAAQLIEAIKPTLDRLDKAYADQDDYRRSAVSDAAGHNENFARRVRSVLAGERKYVSLRVAERMLVNLNLDHYLQDGTIQVVPNPTWSPLYWNAYMRACGVDAPEEVL